jgi:tetratricopeptide (TPR) repeat protein
MFNWFSKSKYGGHVKKLGMTSFWKTLEPLERETLTAMWVKTYNVTFEAVEGVGFKVDQTTLTGDDVLLTLGRKMAVAKNYVLAEKCLKEATSVTKDKDKLHVLYEEMLELYYKQREEDEIAITKCIEMCKKDIALFKADSFDSNESFKRLAIIYENQGKITDAIEIATLAMAYGLSDGTKGGFEGRLEKLKKKLG